MAFDAMSFSDANHARFTNHYNVKLDRCLIETFTLQLEVNSSIFTKDVSDAFEGKEFASYAWISRAGKKYWEVPPTMCLVTMPSGEEKNCSSEDEFDKLIQIYME